MRKAWLLTVLLAASPALAAQAPAPAPSTAPVPAARPANPFPMLPVPKILPAQPPEKGGKLVEAPPAFPGRVPTLPSARACNKGDVEGLWKLLQVYEEPVGAETTSFYTTPSQYLRLNGDSTYGQYIAREDINLSDDMLKRAMTQQTNGLQQYVLQQGMLYFYQNSLAVKTQACFIVDQEREYFPVGQMLLMPPSAGAPTRWVKVYTKIWKEA